MKDIEIVLSNRPGQLALLGETLGKSGVSLEGGGVFEAGENSIAHFLVEDADAARAALESVGIKVNTISDVIIQKLRQDVPGQLGMFCRKLAEAGVNIRTQYSDHSNQLIVVPDDFERAREVSAAWTAEWRR